jgi:hypothetical protein
LSLGGVKPAPPRTRLGTIKNELAIAALFRKFLRVI